SLHGVCASCNAMNLSAAHGVPITDFCDQNRLSGEPEATAAVGGVPRLRPRPGTFRAVCLCRPVEDSTNVYDGRRALGLVQTWVTGCHGCVSPCEAAGTAESFSGKRQRGPPWGRAPRPAGAPAGSAGPVGCTPAALPPQAEAARVQRLSTRGARGGGGCR